MCASIKLRACLFVSGCVYRRLGALGWTWIIFYLQNAHSMAVVTDVEKKISPHQTALCPHENVLQGTLTSSCTGGATGHPHSLHEYLCSLLKNEDMLEKIGEE